MITAFAVNAAQGNGEMKMTKFEEEVKRPVIGIGQSSIKPALGKAVEFYTDKVKEYHNAFSDMNKYIDVIENALEKKDEEIADLKSQLQQQALPVVPECVAKTVELLKKNPESSWSKLYSSLGEEGVTWLNEFQHKDERFGFGGLNSKLFVLFHLAINGYTVEKPQLFYFKHIDMSKADKECDYFAQIRNDRFEHESVQNNTLPGVEVVGVRFTQAEIDSMQIGSYEQIPVPVEDGE